MSERIGIEQGSVGALVYDALTMANAATAKADLLAQAQESHEDICAERYGNINTSLKNLEASFDKQLAMIWKVIAWAGGSAFLIVMGLLAFLSKNQFESIAALQQATALQSSAIAQQAQSPPQVVIQPAADSAAMGATVEPQTRN